MDGSVHIKLCHSQSVVFQAAGIKSNNKKIILKLIIYNICKKASELCKISAEQIETFMEIHLSDCMSAERAPDADQIIFKPSNTTNEKFIENKRRLAGGRINIMRSL